MNPNLGIGSENDSQKIGEYIQKIKNRIENMQKRFSNEIPEGLAEALSYAHSKYKEDGDNLSFTKNFKLEKALIKLEKMLDELEGIEKAKPGQEIEKPDELKLLLKKKGCLILELQGIKLSNSLKIYTEYEEQLKKDTLKRIARLEKTFPKMDGEIQTTIMEIRRLLEEGGVENIKGLNTDLDKVEQILQKDQDRLDRLKKIFI